MAKKKQKWVSNQRQLLIITGLMLVLFVFAFCVYSADSIWSSIKKANNASDSAMTFEGQAVCLPPKNATEPHTMECAVGLKTSGGKYYAVKNKDISSNMGTNTTVKVTGVLETPGDSKYDIVGTINAE